VKHANGRAGAKIVLQFYVITPLTENRFRCAV